MTFILRTAFLAFFALSAWNTLKDLNNFHPALHKSYQKFEKTFTERTGLKFPQQITASNLHQHSELIAKGLAWVQLGLAGAALLLSSWLTCLVGFVYLIQSIVQLNAAKLNFNTPLAEFEPFALVLGLFAASLVLSCNKSEVCNKNNKAKVNKLTESTTSKASTDNKQKKKSQRD